MSDDMFEGLNDETIAKIKELQKITRGIDGNEAYAEAQLEIGQIFYNVKKFQESKVYLKNINKNDKKELYAESLLYIGRLKIAEKRDGLKLEDIDNFIELFEKIKRNYSREIYTKAQYSIIILYSIKNQLDKCILHLKNISISDNPKFFAKAHYYVGKKIINSNDANRISIAKECFENASYHYHYEAYCYSKICELLLDSNTIETGKFLESIFDKVRQILQKLTITFEDSLERKLAHYTTTDVANILLARNTKNNKVGSLRLNTINNVNDPSEGHVLDHYLNRYGGKVNYSQSFDERFQAFVGCFTFNHNSLNQFRLYGKQDNLEASGVSLVFKSSFFNPDSLSNGISFLPSYLSIGNQKQATTSDIEDEEEVKPYEVNSDGKVSNLHIMRCVYIEPESRYVQVAQRNKITFYREFINKDMAEEKWKTYKKLMDDTTGEVSKALERLTTTFQTLKNDYPKDFKDNSELINKILLPLKYLIKHSAFQEEQECRIIYITSISSPEVVMDFGKYMYVEYEPDVKSNLNKIYVAPAATHYQPYLAKLLSDTKVRIDLSKLPYRHT